MTRSGDARSRMRGEAMNGEHGDMVQDLVVEDDQNTEAIAGEEMGETDEEVPALELPEDPDEAIALLVGELLATRTAAAEALDRWQRSVAEFDNYRKRSQRDQAAMVARSSERVLLRLLPVLDSLDAAMAAGAGTVSDESMREGLTGTRDLLLSTLSKEGLEPIQALGEAFDPNLHEAAHIADGSGTMVVEAEWRRGYTLDGRVIRATLVAVGYDAEDTGDSGDPGEEDPVAG